MEHTKNKLPDSIQQFYHSMSEYLDTPLYFYGSVQRNDYIPGKSDIDVCIFTDNFEETIVRMQHFLHLPASKFKRFVLQLTHKNKILYGKKVAFHDEEFKFRAEFAVYNTKDKEDFLREQQIKLDLPFYVSWALVIIKMLYYHLQIIDRDTYRKWKNKLLSFNNGYIVSPYVVID
jgi:predicted nucleotidyltransferase